MNTSRLPQPSSNGHHDPAELEKKQHIRQLKEKARSSIDLWFGCVFLAVALFAVVALILSLVAIFK